MFVANNKDQTSHVLCSFPGSTIMKYRVIIRKKNHTKKQTHCYIFNELVVVDKGGACALVTH